MSISSFLAIAFAAQLVIAQDVEQVLAEPEDQVQEIAESADYWSLSNVRLRDFTLYWENDGTVPNMIDDTDRYYTNGNGIEFSFDPQISGNLADRLSFGGDWNEPRFGVGIALKQMIYTGVDINDRTPAPDDHPYAGYMYLAFSFQRADDKKHDHFELDLGVVGEWSQAEAIQRWIHHVFPDEIEPQGWGNQLANEVAINVTYDRTWKTEPGEIEGVEFEMLPSIGFDLGNVHTRARGRLTLRAGHNLPDDFGPATLLGHKDHTVSAADWGEGDFSIYGYTTLGIDAVAWNIFLDGNTFADSRSTDSEIIVAQATLGLVTRYKSLYLGWSQTLQTEEFEAQVDRQTWGSIVFGFSCDL